MAFPKQIPPNLYVSWLLSCEDLSFQSSEITTEHRRKDKPERLDAQRRGVGVSGEFWRMKKMFHRVFSTVAAPQRAFYHVLSTTGALKSTRVSVTPAGVSLYTCWSKRRSVCVAVCLQVCLYDCAALVSIFLLDLKRPSSDLASISHDSS